jgi:hypothetical protein
MLFHTPTLSASIVAVLALYAVATPTGSPPPHSADELMSRGNNAPSYPSPPHLSKPYSYSGNNVKVDGASYAPPPPKPPQGKPKPEAKPYVSSLSYLSPLPLTPTKEEKPRPHEKDHPSAPPPKSYPEKPKSEGKPYLPLPPILQNLKPEKKLEETPYVFPAQKEKKFKPKPNEKPYSEKYEVKQKDQDPKDDDKNGCVGGKCRRAEPVSCVDPHFRSLVSNRGPKE